MNYSTTAQEAKKPGGNPQAKPATDSKPNQNAKPAQDQQKSNNQKPNPQQSKPNPQNSQDKKQSQQKPASSAPTTADKRKMKVLYNHLGKEIVFPKTTYHHKQPVTTAWKPPSLVQTAKPPPKQPHPPNKIVDKSILRSGSINNLNPVYDSSKLMESQVLEIHDLAAHVSATPYTNKFNDKLNAKGGASPKLPKDKKFSLFGVFDGHQGKFAAEYVKARLPYELANTPELLKGDYEGALKKAYANVHAALLACEMYKPEPTYDFTSGTTATVALITPDKTYFAQLGDTSIFTFQNVFDEECGSHIPKILFPDIEEAEKQRVIESEAPVVHNYGFPASDLIRTKHLQKKPKEVILGYSELRSFGTIGDSFYDPKVFNLFVEELNKYKEEHKEEGGNHKLVSEWIQSRPSWKTLSKHMQMFKNRLETSYLLNGVFEGTYARPGPIKHNPLTQEPRVKSVDNSAMHWFSIMSSGFLMPKYENFQPAGVQLHKYLEGEDNGFERKPLAWQWFLRNWIYFRIEDDISAVFVSMPRKSSAQPAN